MLEILAFVEAASALHPESRELQALALECEDCARHGVTEGFDWFARRAAELVLKDGRTV